MNKLLKLITKGWENIFLFKEYFKLCKTLSKKQVVLPTETKLLNGLKTQIVNYLGDIYNLDNEEKASMFVSNDWRFDVKSNITIENYPYRFLRMESNLK